MPPAPCSYQALCSSFPTLTHSPRPSLHPSPQAFPDPSSFSSSHNAHWSYTAHLKIKHGCRAALVSCLYSYLTLTLTINFSARTPSLPNQTVSSLIVEIPPLIGLSIIVQSQMLSFTRETFNTRTRRALQISQGGLLLRLAPRTHLVAWEHHFRDKWKGPQE